MGYGNTGLEDLAAMQRASASAAGLHTLPTTGYYDPNNQFAATSLGAAVANRDAGNTNLANQLNSLATGIVSSSTSSSTGGTTGNSASATTLGSTSGFGSTSGATATAVNNAAADATSSPGPATSTGSTGGSGTGSTGVGQHHSVQQAQQQQQQQQQQQTAFNLAATNAFAAQQMPPGYAYYLSNMGNMGLQHYGATTPNHVYQPTAMTVPGAGANTSQFPKSYGTNYGSGYDTLGQQQGAPNAGNKDYSGNYSSNGQSKSNGGQSAGSAGQNNKGAHQYWGNTLTNTQMW